jgi:hypothetical protein
LEGVVPEKSRWRRSRWQQRLFRGQQLAGWGGADLLFLWRRFGHVKLRVVRLLPGRRRLALVFKRWIGGKLALFFERRIGGKIALGQVAEQLIGKR